MVGPSRQLASSALPLVGCQVRSRRAAIEVERPIFNGG